MGSTALVIRDHPPCMIADDERVKALLTWPDDENDSPGSSAMTYSEIRFCVPWRRRARADSARDRYQNQGSAL